MEIPADPGSLHEKICFLDCALTRCSYQVALQSYRNNDPLWIENHREYYLSDGGYSRIVFNDRGSLFLTDNSSPRAKVQMTYCQELIADIEKELRQIADWLP